LVYSNPDDQDTDTSSDSDLDPGSHVPTNNNAALLRRSEAAEFEDDDDDSGLSPIVGTYIQTKNELLDSDIAIPNIDSVGPEEELELVGEVMSVIEMVVVVKGTQSDNPDRAAGRALDSGTLLVFDDRKVLGYVSVVHLCLSV
jgi:H/ACA ribonucleoprotein complex non-core subunit NAF1